MTDPHAPDNYSFENQDELEKALADAKEVAERFNDLSFGDAATQIERAVYRIEHYATEDHWTRVTRAAHNYVRQCAIEMKHPQASASYSLREDEPKTERLSVSFVIELPGTVTEFIEQWDPGNAFDKECPICHARPKNPCLGKVDEGFAVHQERRFA